MPESVGLMDLERAKREVEVAPGKTVTMWAVSVAGIAHILTKYPVARKLLNGGFKEKDFSLEKVVTGAPEVVAELIACGADSPGDAGLIAHTQTLSVGLQMALLEGVINATLEGGMAPFVQRLTRMLGGFGASLPADFASLTGEPVSTSPSPLNT